MKKFLVSVLATSMCLACLTACGGDKKVATDLDGAAEWVESLYQDVNVSVNRDYEVVNSVLYDGQTYSVTWSVDVTDGVKVVKGSEMTTVDVNEVSEVDIEYVLTATVKDANGDTKTVTFNRVVKAASDKVPGPIQSAPEEETPYKLHLYHKNKQKDCYFVGEMSSFYFKTSEDPEKAVDIYVEYKADSETEFYPYFLDSNETKQYIGMKVSADGKHNNIVYETAPVSVFVWNDELKTITTTIVDSDGKETEFFIGVQQKYDTMQACDIKYKDDNNIAHLIGMIDRNSVDAAEKVKQEKNVLTAPRAFVGEASYDLAELGLTFADVKITWAVAGEGASVNGNVLTVKAGADTATVKLTATLSCGDASDTAEFDVVIVPNDAAKIMAAGDALGDGGKFANEVTFTGVVTKVNSKYDAEYGNVTVTIDVNGTSVYCYRVAGAGADVLAEGYTVTVKGFIENFKGSAQIGQGGTIVDYVAGEAPEKPDSSVEGDSSTSSSTPDDDSSSSDVSVSSATLDMMGTTNLKNRTAEQATYSANGITYVNDKAASNHDCYDQQGTYAARAYQGSTITISHSTAFSKIVFTLDDYSNGEYLLAFDGMEIAGATITRNNDVVTITLSAATTSFTTANLIKQARIEKIEVFFGGSSVTPDDDTSSPVTPDSGSSSVTPDDNSSSGSTDDSKLDTPEEIVDAAWNLGLGETLGDYTLTGVITSIDDPYSTQYKNVTVTIVVGNMTDKPIICFRMKGTGADLIKVGDTITVSGTLLNFIYDENDTTGEIEFTSGCTLDSYIPAGGDETPDDDNPSSGGSTGTLSTPAEIVDAAYALAEGASLTGTYTLTGVILSAETYNTEYNNITVVISVNGADSSKTITCYRMKGSGADVIAAGYTITVSGTLTNYNGTIEFTAGCTLDSYVYGEPPVKEGAELSFADVANRKSFSADQQVWEQNGITVTNDQASSTSAVADYSNPARFYKSSSLTIECAGMTKIEFVCNNGTYATALQNSITDANVTVTISGTSVYVEFATATDSFTIETLSAQVRVNSIYVTK